MACGIAHGCVLLRALEHFLINEWKRAQCAKRGGGTTPLSPDVAAAEQRYTNEPAVTLTPERAYEKQWAATLLEQVLSKLKHEKGSVLMSAWFGLTATLPGMARKLRVEYPGAI